MMQLSLATHGSVVHFQKQTYVVLHPTAVCVSGSEYYYTPTPVMVSSASRHTSSHTICRRRVALKLVSA